MENTKPTQTQAPSAAPANAQVYYIIGAVVLIAVIAVGFMLRPKTAPPAGTPTTTESTQTAGQQVAESPAVKMPIKKLGCDQQYFNPVIGISEQYYLSVDGVDVDPAKSATCTFTISQEGKEVSTETVQDMGFNPNTERGGYTFKCTTQAVKLKKTIPTKVAITLKDDQGDSATCQRFFTLP